MKKILLITMSVLLLAFASSAHAGVVNVWGETPYPSLSLANISNFYNSLSGHSSSVITGQLDSNDLSGVNLLWATQPSNAYTAGEISTMSTFLSNGGRIAFMGEHGSGIAENENLRINSAVAALGGHMTILNGMMRDPGDHVATVANGQILAHSLTVGVNDYIYAAYAPIELSGAAQQLMLGQSLSSTMMAYENIGAGSIFLITDQNVWDPSRKLGYDNDILFENLLAASTGAPSVSGPANAVPEPATMLLFATGLVGAFVRKVRKV